MFLLSCARLLHQHASRARRQAEKAEVGRRLSAADDVGDRSARTAGHGPAERAMTGVEKEIRITRAADERNVGRGRGPQAGPELGALGPPGAWKKLERAVNDRPAADLVDRGVVTVQLRRTSDAQPIA